MFGLWQQVAGRIEKGETAPQAVLREIKEETGLIPTALYSADIVEIFYEDNHKCIHIIPVFAAVADPKANVVLSDEHSDCKWVSASHAKKYVTFVQQKSSIDIVNKEFALKKPRKSCGKSNLISHVTNSIWMMPSRWASNPRLAVLIKRPRRGYFVPQDYFPKNIGFSYAGVPL
jgi:dATP pyrophosphohydrolase